MPDEQLSGDVVSVLKEVAVSEGFKRPEFTRCGGTKPGDNYASVVHRVRVEEKGGGQKLSAALIVKRQPDSAPRREKMNTELFFQNEAVAYNEVFPAFLQFQQEKGILEDFSPPHPRCLRAGELLIMEDQSARGFIMRDRREPLDRGHCLLVMRELGRMHAMSFALRDQRPSLFQKLVGVVKETLLGEDITPTFRSFFDVSGPKALEILEKHCPHPQKMKYVDASRRIAASVTDTLTAVVKREAAEPYAVISHGDCWTSNMLFKYNQDNSAPEKVCFLDFQLVRASSPACDITYFLYCCTDKNIRQAHYHEFIQEYHSSLAAYLARLGSDVDKLFPMEALQDQLKRFGKYGLCMAMVTIPFFTCDSEDIPNIDTACDGDDEAFVKAFSLDQSNDKRFSERLCDVFVNVVDLGYVL